MRALTASAALLACGGVALAPAEAAAAGEDDVVVRQAERSPMLAPVGPRAELTMHRELDWVRLTLADEFALRLGPTQLDGTLRAWDGESAQIDIRNDVWTAAPPAMTSVATAATSLLTSGISVFEVWKGGRILARHGVRMYWRSRGLMVAWRVEF